MEQQLMTFAREYRGLSMTALASRVRGLSQPNLSNYERGRGGLSEAIKESIMLELGFPLEFLGLDIGNRIENKHYRKKASISEGARKAIDRRLSLIAYLFDWLSEYVELPTFGFQYMDVESGATPEEAARWVRRKLRVGDAPLDGLCRHLERNGVFVYPWDCAHEEFDGVSLITDKGFHLVIVNANKPADRVRFSVAHELGHALMHESVDFFIPECRDKEAEANRFASELLMPTDGVRNSLVGVTMKQLLALKGYWMVSIGALVQKARQLGCITEQRYKNLRIEMSRNGWNRNEPVSIGADEPSVIRQAMRLVTDTLGYSCKDIAAMAHLPLDFVEEAMVGDGARVVRLAL